MEHHTPAGTAEEAPCTKPKCITEMMPECPEKASHELLMLSMCAKKDLMRDKMKAHLDKKMGAKMDEVADVITDALIAAWKGHVGKMKGKHELVQKIAQMMTE